MVDGYNEGTNPTRFNLTWWDGEEQINCYFYSDVDIKTIEEVVKNVQKTDGYRIADVVAGVIEYGTYCTQVDLWNFDRIIF
jgi:hypothetical protein